MISISIFNWHTRGVCLDDVLADAEQMRSRLRKFDNEKIPFSTSRVLKTNKPRGRSINTKSLFALIRI